MQGDGAYIESGLLVRPRVHGLLQEGASHPLCCVTAGTGYGKTRSVTSFLQATGARHLWVQLTDMDNYIPRFWEILIHAVGAVNKPLAREMQQLGFPASPEQLYTFTLLLQRCLRHASRLHIVLDDVHKIGQPAILRLVEALAEAHIDNLCILLLSRQDVPLNYFTLYNNGRLASLSAEDLRFTPGEIADYYQLLGIDFTPEVLAGIYESTGGWPMALYLIGLHRLNSGEAAGDPMPFTMPLVNSMIEVEIFSVYPPAVQAAFTRMSLLETVPLDIARAICGDAFPEAEQALRHNMFVRHSPFSDNHYLFHRLFRQFLQARRDALPEEERRRLYRMTGDWYLARGRHSEALDYYEKCGEYEKQWQIMQWYAKEDYTPEKSSRCLSLVQAFPTEFLRQHPLVPVYEGYMHLNLGNIGQAAACFEGVLQQYDGNNTPEASRLCGEAWLGLFPVSLYNRDKDYVRCAERARALLPTGSVYMKRSHHYLGNRNALTFYSFEAGALDANAEKLAYAMGVAAGVMNGCGAGIEFLVRAEVGFYRGHMEAAVENAHRAMLAAREFDQRDVVCACYYLLMRVWFAKGNYEKTLGYLYDMERYAESIQEHYFWGVDGVAQAWFYHRVGHLKAVPRWIFEAAAQSSALNTVSVSRERVEETACLIRMGEYEKALARLDRLITLFEVQLAPLSTLKSLAHKAICLYELGRHEEAAAVFLHTCSLCMPNNIRMTLVEEGAYTVRLAALLKPGGLATDLAAWLNGVVEAARDYAQTAGAISETYWHEYGP